jgi:two-component system phosphate regulon sensor histidine kinase PhoR
MLRNATHNTVGALIVLNDVTRLRKLEQVRRDFVANVSHELKTPITSIKGYVETLLDGAFRNPEDAERFLKIVAKQANRLNAIIEDLLKLSRIEQGVERGEIVLEQTALKGLLTAAISACETQITAKSIHVSLSCPDDLVARINPPLLEQAVVNLIDNAAKYGNAGSAIEISAIRDSSTTSIIVRDHGVGIASEHLPRLFERFYRVDKARSRAEGGTGLGLAIAKHIVLAHGGTISVDSRVSQGSTFTINLPLR